MARTSADIKGSRHDGALANLQNQGPLSSDNGKRNRSAGFGKGQVASCHGFPGGATRA